MHTTAAGLLDSESGYGRISRTLHWLMAVLFACQFTSALLHEFAHDTPAEEFFWQSHYSVGATLWALVLLRGVWGLANLGRRPKHGDSLLGRAAVFGQVLMYVLMIVVPSLGILRAIGSDRAFAVYGVELIAAGGAENEMLIAPANAAHGILGFTLLALIIGHIAMALWHGLVRRDATLDHMTRGWSDKPAFPDARLARRPPTV